MQPTALYEGLTTSVALTSDDMFFYLFHGDRFVDLNILVESSSGAVDVQVRCWKKGKGGRGCLLRGKSRVGEGGRVFGGAFFFPSISPYPSSDGAHGKPTCNFCFTAQVGVDRVPSANTCPGDPAASIWYQCETGGMDHTFEASTGRVQQGVYFIKVRRGLA